jgi:hypothetical protein
VRRFSDAREGSTFAATRALRRAAVADGDAQPPCRVEDRLRGDPDLPRRRARREGKIAGPFRLERRIDSLEPFFSFSFSFAVDAASASSRASAAAAAVKSAGQAFDRGTTHPSCGFRKSPRESFSKEVSTLTESFSRVSIPRTTKATLNAPKPARVLSRGVFGGAESTAPALARPPETDRLTSLCPLTPPGTGTSAPRDTSHSNAKTNDEEEVRVHFVRAVLFPRLRLRVGG